MSYRGIPASALHNTKRHMYIAVDAQATNWKEHVFERINHLPHGGILHIMNYRTMQEIERMYV